jgi:hypothetical protein
MEQYLSQFLSYLLNVLQSTLNQLFILFGPLLILAILLSLSASYTARLSVRFWGRNLFLYGFGWLGCSVHELSHAFFALIFGHKITEIELFKPSGNGESLGHVSHSYNKKNIYQKIGNFFIGIGPILSGGIVLFLISLILFRLNITSLGSFRITSDAFTDFALLKQFWIGIWHSFLSYLTIVFNGSNAIWWKSILLIYVLYSIGSSMTLSKSDIGSALSGFLWFALFVLIFNLITLWIGGFAVSFLKGVAAYISGFYFLLILSCAANLLFILILIVLNFMLKLVVSR